jgi:hypothetical protein
VKRSSKPRETAKLSDSLHKRVNMYALAGSAAGVGVLALAQPAEAKIVYTKADVTIGLGGELHHKIDLNHDGINDFSFSYPGTSFGPHTAALMVRPLGKGNKVVARTSGTHRQKYFPAALYAKALVGPKRRFESYKQQAMAGSTTALGTSSQFGNWFNVTNRYLGFEFVIKGKVHYGWARLSVTNDDGGEIQGTLTGFAYETVANKPIIAGNTEGAEESDVDEANPATLNEPTPQPAASLGLLAMGSPGLSAWRREESVAAAPEAK